MLFFPFLETGSGSSRFHLRLTDRTSPFTVDRHTRDAYYFMKTGRTKKDKSIGTKLTALSLLDMGHRS